MVAKLLKPQPGFELIAFAVVDPGSDFAGRLPPSLQIARVSAIDFTRFSHPSFTSIARK
jgi:hypothetical protein